MTRTAYTPADFDTADLEAARAARVGTIEAAPSSDLRHMSKREVEDLAHAEAAEAVRRSLDDEDDDGVYRAALDRVVKFYRPFTIVSKTTIEAQLPAGCRLATADDEDGVTCFDWTVVLSVGVKTTRVTDAPDPIEAAMGDFFASGPTSSRTDPRSAASMGLVRARR